MEQCCGTTCDKAKLTAELKATGATEFVDYLEMYATEDMSTEAVARLLFAYRTSLLGLPA
jgi:hypothetical protein